MRRANWPDCWRPLDQARNRPDDDGQDRDLADAQRDQPCRQCSGAGRMRSGVRRRAVRRCCSHPRCRGCSTATASGRRARSAAEAEDQVLGAMCERRRRRTASGFTLGSLALREGGGKLVNRGFVIDASGEIAARYDKMHLFDVDLPTGESWRESAVYQSGDAAVVVRGTPVGSLGLTICYDLRFPAIFERLSEAGAEVIAVAGGVHRSDGTSALACAASGACDRGRAVRCRRGAIGAPRRWPRDLRP